MAIDTPAGLGSLSIRGNAYPIYGTQARASEYFAAHVDGDAFLDADFEAQQRALVTANRLINRQTFLVGPAVGNTITAFPQLGEITVPVDVEVAQYEIALILLDNPEFFNQNTTGSNDRRLRAGPVELEFFAQTLNTNTIGGGASPFPPQIQDLLRPFLGSSVSITAPVYSGADNPSRIIDADAFDISDGL